MEYIAFLRGINIGKRQVKMQDLQKVFEDQGFSAVKTLIASGNVLFDAEENEAALREKLEKVLEENFVFHIPVILRTKEEIQKLVAAEPFKNIIIEPGMRLQITLFGEEIQNTQRVAQNGFTITSAGARELASVVEPNGKTTDLVTFIDKTFGKNSTTRNWNTIQKFV